MEEMPLSILLGVLIILLANQPFNRNDEEENHFKQISISEISENLKKYRKVIAFTSLQNYKATYLTENHIKVVGC